jgi:ABC-2 type transport system ATP-binding protein
MTFSVSIEGVSKNFKTVKALDSISIVFEEKKMHGVIGPEGAGKTTLMRLIAGLLKPAAGKIKYFEDSKQVDFEYVKQQIAYMPQQQSLYPDLSIEEHLEFFKALYDLGDTEYRKKRDYLLEITRLDKFLNRPAGKLSGGMYKKLGLMCSLLRAPKILLLDEPTNGVDPISRREFWELLYELEKENILVITTTAYMDEAQKCTSALLIQDGKTICSGSPKNLLEQNNVKDFDMLFRKMTGEAG